MSETRTILLLGDSGEGKTTQLALIALWMWRKHGLKSKLITVDGGGAAQFNDLGLIEQGIVDHYDLRRSPYPISMLSRLSKGYWPKETAPGEFALRETAEFRVDYSKYGAILFDSMTGLGEFLQEYVSQPGNSAGFKLGAVTSEDGYSFGTLDKGHFNVIQKEMRKALYLGFPMLGAKLYACTARIDKSEAFNKISCYFPDAPGKALGKEIVSWFEDSYHLEQKIVTGAEMNQQFKLEGDKRYPEDGRAIVKVAWFRTHPDVNTSIEYKAKFRMASQGLKYVDARFPNGYCILDHDLGIVRFMNYIELVGKKVKAEMLETPEKEVRSRSNDDTEEQTR